MTTKNLQLTKQARKIITKHLRELNVRTNLDNFLSNIHKNQRETQIAKLEQIDADITHAMLRGAKAYNKKHSIWWSPTLHHAYLELIIGKSNVSKAQQKFQ